ncbi:PadR family transcriptional regulator [Nocardia sp. SYP-A9097]|uniref:PadR family transcriptional regulator n=1 Tax=Nocardia sp. SYP-A9097 TaxID=2663237 RepID=UPI00129AB1FE|nr:PadR family transcriptional regulator [Nocardia sp. SYP-A9097]MRH88088.1 PadR family transcriptional regulator [Nocardia sp. SYP-A9097]
MSLRYALLGLVAQEPSSGYDLLGRFKISLGQVWPATQSQIYTELTKLADAELIKVSDEGARGRKEYSITDDGLAQLQHWLTETMPKRVPRNEMLLRVFFLGLASRVQARAYLGAVDEEYTKVAQHLRTLGEAVDWDDSDLSVYGRMAMEWGERFAAMNQEWARWALEQIPERRA